MTTRPSYRPSQGRRGAAGLRDASLAPSNPANPTPADAWLDQIESPRIAEAVEAERARIAHDLHDSLGGLLTAAHLISSDLAKRLSSADRELAARTVAYVAEAMQQVRAACESLVDTRDPATALADIAATADGVGGVRCTAEIAPDAPLPHGADGRALALIVREAVTNAVRHARARSIAVAAAADEGRLVVSVVDDGDGMPDGPSTGLGLASMTDRAARLGASLTFEPTPGGGTTVRLTRPAAAPPPPPSPTRHA
jgi:signal transduction histidine kinase